jgi:hypothetical protein
MALSIDSIPNTSVRPAGAKASPGRRLLEKRFISRRGVLKLVAGTGMVLGLSAVGVLGATRNASAALRGESPWQYWSSCSDYSNFGDPWRECNITKASVLSTHCRAVVSSTNKWRHRTDSPTRQGECSYVQDYRRDNRCTGNSGTTNPSTDTGLGPPSRRGQGPLVHPLDCARLRCGSWRIQD